MKLEIHLHLHAPNIEASLARIESSLDTIIVKEVEMAGELAELQTEVAEIGTVAESAIALLNGLKAKLDEAIASGNPAALKALSAELDAKALKLAAAITANTPSEEPPPPQ